MSDETIHLRVTINGKSFEGEVRPDRTLIDFLHEELQLTGTKFSCGIGACGACKVALRPQPDGPLIPVLGCFARMNAVNDMEITTVEGIGKVDALHPLQQAFLKDYSFQCGFSTPGFLMAGFVLIDRLRRNPVAESQLDRVIQDALATHVCRCTGYVRYFAAIRRVILQTQECISDAQPAKGAENSICFRIVKQSTNDVQPKTLVGYFRNPTGRLEFVGGLNFDTCRGVVRVPIETIATGEPVRDLNLRKFFFTLGGELVFTLDRVEPFDKQLQLADVEAGATIPISLGGVIHYASWSLRVSADVFVQRENEQMRVVSRTPLLIDPRDLGFALDSFSNEFGLTLDHKVEISLDFRLPYTVS